MTSPRDDISSRGQTGEVMLMLLADARLPTGAHTQSAGLEPALRAGVPASSAPAYIRARLRTVTAVEAAAAVVARGRTVDATRGFPEVELSRALAEVDAAWRARTVSPALRETSVLLGRGYARLVRTLWPATAGANALATIGRPGRAVVLGVAAALAGLSGAQLVRLIGYDDAQTIAAATLKLEPLDPVVATSWVMAAGEEIERMVGDLAQLTDIDEMPAYGAPLIEQWAEIHSVTSQRLFRA
jgi:urease accessory protein